jgi:hypothetical protein
MDYLLAKEQLALKEQLVRKEIQAQQALAQQAHLDQPVLQVQLALKVLWEQLAHLELEQPELLEHKA